MSQIIATYRLQDKPEAVALRDRLKEEGKNAYLTMDLSSYRYGGQIHVHVVAPSRKAA